MNRTHYCNDVGADLTGQPVTLCGWVHRRRDHGGVIFVDLRDRTGIVQAVFNPEHPDAHGSAHGLRSEYVIQVTGLVSRRPPETENPNLATGLIEVIVDALLVLNTCGPLPFQLDEEVGESMRLAWRFLDLRRPAMQKNLITRHRIMQTVRNHLDGNGFLELETPFLTRSTPEGARDYLVPSRVNAGQFFALPQSPQLFKQLLMVAGYDRYFQITRCFRDEDLRADRQPEFTQIDLEMSFVQSEDVMSLTEGLVARLFREVLEFQVPLPIPRLTYEECMARYGLDAPDLRINLELQDLTPLMAHTGFKVFADAVKYRGPGGEGGLVKVMRVPGGAALTRKQIDEFTEFVGLYGAKGLAWIKVNAPWREEGWQSPIIKFLSEAEKDAIAEVTKAQAGDILFFGAGAARMVNESLGRLRVKIGREVKELNLMGSNPYVFTWVCDFPLLEWDAEAGRNTSVHHPFTAPHPEDASRCVPPEDIEQDVPLPGIRSQAYDLVLNGSEIGGGSIRIHSPEMQKQLFQILHIGPEEAEEKFGFLIKALEFGAPPHGGLALGLDRLCAIMLGAESIRDVIAFPKTQKASCLLTQAPSRVSETQLRELHIRLRKVEI